MLFTPLQNYKTKLPYVERMALQKFIRITFNLCTVVVSEKQAMLLYVAVVRLCKDRQFGWWDLVKYKEKLISTE